MALRSAQLTGAPCTAVRAYQNSVATARPARCTGSLPVIRRQQPGVSNSKSQLQPRRLLPRVQAYNWGDTDARESDSEPGKDDDGFDKDTLAVMLRVLTARATQKALLTLQETDMYAANWLSNFASTNPPIEGNKFLTKLYKEPSVSHVDAISRKTHFISPTLLANRILTMRDDMAKTLAAQMPAFSERDNIELMRAQLEANSYVSGSYDKKTPKGQTFPRWNL